MPCAGGGRAYRRHGGFDGHQVEQGGSGARGAHRRCGAKPLPNPDPDPDSDPDPDPDSHPDADPDSHPDPDPDSHPDGDPEPDQVRNRYLRLKRKAPGDDNGGALDLAATTATKKGASPY